MASQPGEIGVRDLEQLMAWYRAIGVDEAIGGSPVRDFSPPVRRMETPTVPTAGPTPSPVPPTAESAPPPPRQKPPSALSGMIEASDEARRRAAAANTLDDLRAALDAFDGCPLKTTVINTVFADGNPEASIMIVGEAPGREEDRQGKPFVGESGRLLDRMLGAIGLDRTSVYITNTVLWRPPGNRKPNPSETQAMLPFLVRHIELVRPKIMMLAGGAALSALFGMEARITRERGKWRAYEASFGTVPVLPVFHPAYLLRNPAAKKETWADMLAFAERLDTVRGDRP